MYQSITECSMSSFEACLISFALLMSGTTKEEVPSQSSYALRIWLCLTCKLIAGVNAVGVHDVYDLIGCQEDVHDALVEASAFTEEQLKWVLHYKSSDPCSEKLSGAPLFHPS